MLSTRFYILQRLSALVMIPLVFGHLAVMIYAIGGGLSAAEILARTQGSIAWFLFYGLFVIAVSIHGAIGLKVILSEWAGINAKVLDGFSFLVGTLLLLLGMRAVWAVTFSGAIL